MSDLLTALAADAMRQNQRRFGKKKALHVRAMIESHVKRLQKNPLIIPNTDPKKYLNRWRTK